MMTTNSMSVDTDHDARLVAATISGDRDAFGVIVTRYQSLICSLAYSATGSLGQSEDLAQETFITAWKQMGQLREPAKLRSWLCGIARNLINNWLRRQGREPSHAAESLEMIPESPATEPLPPEHTISNEEAALLWRSLERIPEMYREPLVLFYREHQSVEQVARDLELSEDAVKQRLSRGRKLLHEQVLTFVEGALQRTNPGKAFTFGVLAALPLFAVSATAATTGAAAMKGSSAAQASAALGVAGVILGPLAGLLGAWVGVKASLASARSERERQFLRRQTKVMVIFVSAFAVAVPLALYATARFAQNRPWLIAIGVITLIAGYVALLFIMIFCCNRQLRLIRAQEQAAGRAEPEPAWTRGFSYEYRTQASFLGLPLIHCCSGPAPNGRRRIAKGWIACGEVAFGAIAFGGVAVGLFSMGGAAIGLIALGGAAVGGLAFGGFGLGYYALGGGAVGYLAFGGAAMAWKAAMGGTAMAHDFALGGGAYAAHANDAIAAEWIKGHPFFHYAEKLVARVGWLTWLPMVLVIWPALRVLRMRQRGPVAK
jgi:RNA polymerase sigma factor (sigma-70 family)